MSQGSPAIGAAVAQLTRDLARAGIDTPGLDARLLVGHALTAGPETVIGYPERILTAEEWHRLQDLGRRRSRREPLAQITGAREFWSLSFNVTADTLTPRPESETLVEAALAHVAAGKAKALKILDLGTGSGCLLLALLHELPQAFGVGVDISATALTVARDNAHALGLARRAVFAASDWAAALSGGFDLVVANPPYIEPADLAGLAPEIRDFEPRIALNGGLGGLAAYQIIAPQLGRLLRPGGAAILEIGMGQAAAVAAILADNGLKKVKRLADLAKIDRCLLATP